MNTEFKDTPPQEGKEQEIDKKRFFILDGDSPIKEVTLEEFMSYERSAGFHSKFEDSPATAGFSNNNVSGREIRGFVANNDEQASEILKEHGRPVKGF